MIKHTILGLLLPSLLVSSVFAQLSLPGEERINGKLVWAAFEPQREILQQSSAVIFTDEKSHIKSLYGVVVSESGHVLTKASEIEDFKHLSVRVDSELYENVQLVATDDNWDVALLKIDAEADFRPIKLSDEESLAQGQWVISNGSTTRRSRRVRLGVVCAETRKILATSSNTILGVELDVSDEAIIKINKVIPKSGAAKGGLKQGDVITHIGLVAVSKPSDILQCLQGKEGGDSLEIHILRGKKILSFDVELMARPGGPPQMSRNDLMGGGVDILSERRAGFPRVIQHDIPLSKVSVGGPLLNLEGDCIGMNIARASRVGTFAIPARELQGIIDDMMP